MASRKVDFARKAREQATAIANAINELEELKRVYNASGYAPNGHNPIVDDDIIAHDMTAEQLVDFANFAGNFIDFVNGETPTVGNYRDILSEFRNV